MTLTGSSLVEAVLQSPAHLWRRNSRPFFVQALRLGMRPLQHHGAQESITMCCHVLCTLGADNVWGGRHGSRGAG